ncbi:hypothetical protein FRB94_000969 [Tulasnella sp. JGI-2019a]|nr:hypothetical protein FRB94_000969 [Tulasnella sp. JGI-2019a]KAG9033308.1 hypothetical protein FRB95_000315 [Tulasnella sp. JGI-2019a]
MPAPLEHFPKRVGDIYPGIAPAKFERIHDGKVVFGTSYPPQCLPSVPNLTIPAVTGGGTGLGLSAAKAFSQAGAKVFLSARRAATLEIAKTEIESMGGEADSAVADVTDSKSVVAAVVAAIQRFGKIGIVIANAGKDCPMGKSGEFDPEDWYSTVDTSLKGCYFTTHATLPHIIKSQGYIILISSSLAQTRALSPYNIVKHAIDRLAEWIDLECKTEGVKSFAVHPGAVPTELSSRFQHWLPSGHELFVDTPELSPWSYVRLTSGSENRLSGRFVDVEWDLDELAKMKTKIVEQDALKNRLALPT